MNHYNDFQPVTLQTVIITALIILAGYAFIFWVSYRHQKDMEKKWRNRYPQARKYPGEVEKKLALDEHEQRLS